MKKPRAGLSNTEYRKERTMQHIDENMMNTQLRELKPFIMIKGSLRAIRQSIRKAYGAVVSGG